VSALELAPSGQGYRTKTRFVKFVNLPEMLKMYRKFVDVKTADMLNLPVPKVTRHVITIKPSDEILQYNEIIVARAERIAGGNVKPEVDNMLKITSDGKKLALDPRCLDKLALDNDKHKINICAQNVFKVWRDTQDKHSTQLVFCDLSTPKVAFKDYDSNAHFDIYNDLKRKLVEKGIPENEVAFIHDANTDTAKQVLFDNIRSGKVRILLGSTEKCGVGTNVQHKLIAIHHLDTPYRPSDMEQREGRAIRQGNENAEIEIFTYVTEKTFDAYSYQILENKQRFISQINSGKLTVREASDIDETTLTYAEIKAITSANPLIKRKNEVELELNRLRTLQIQHQTNRYNLQDNVLNVIPKEIKQLEKYISNLQKNIALRDKNLGMITHPKNTYLTKSINLSDTNPPSTNINQDFSMIINDKTFTNRKDAAVMYHQFANNNSNAGKTIATYNSFNIIPEHTDNLLNRYVTIKGNGSYQIPLSNNPLDSIYAFFSKSVSLL